MSSFFKGIFGGKESEHGQVDGEMPPPQMDALDGDRAEDIGELEASVQGTVETEREADVSASGTIGGDQSDRRADASPEGPMFSAPDPAPEKPERADGGDRLLDNAPEPPVSKEFSAQRVWHESGVGPIEQATVEKAQHLLSSLPDSTPDEVKRQIVEASLVAFEVSIADITAGAESEIEALRSYIDAQNADAEDFKAAGEARISELETEIERIRGTIADAESERERRVGAATEVIDEVQPVLDFFSPTASRKAADLPRPTKKPESTSSGAVD